MPPPAAQPTAGATLPDPRRAQLIFSLFALYVIWGSTYLAIHFALEGGFPPLVLAGVRYGLAGAVLYAFLRLRGHANPSARQWLGGAVLGLLLLTLGNGSVVVAQQWVPSGVAALVVGSVPLWAALFSGLLGQWPGRAERWGLAIGFCGLIVLNLGSDLRGNSWATFALLLAPVSWAFGSVWSRRLPQAPGLMSSATQMLCASVLFFLGSMVKGEHLAALPTPRALLALGYLITFGSLVAFSAYGFLLRNTRPSLAMSYAYVNPVVAVLLGVALAGESMSPTGMVAMGAILGSVVLLTRARG
ncbi:Permease of the drug/metabolite transporter (DMT) superfamily [Melittangium boletus DSM 14713]|uniref:Permease of the drug/metabolite transporter (DMT) superfamily n=2 Tax=Melittangium boletus TaxID=83453 RepID=A0A250ICU5_9BACT|nr:Permease of the drug/metabolite transporter (DMT) superfamily [Melittangium boletus DSM 14713]